MGNAARVIHSSDQFSGSAAQAAKPALLHPLADLLMIGGASLIFFFLASVFLNRQAPDSQTAWFIYNLSFAVNFPHFLVSYQMLYWDFRSNIFKKPRFLWAAVVMPAALLAYLVIAFANANATHLGYLANAMFFFVGWHYVKQTFGGIVVSNALHKIYFTKAERSAVKATLYSLWALSWINSNSAANSLAFEGIPYQSLGLGPEWLSTAGWMTVATSLWMILVHAKKYIREGKAVVSAPALVCIASLFAWYIPSFYHPTFFLLVPFFHSLQYLLFVIAFRKNKAAHLAGARNCPAERKNYLVHLFGYLVLPIATGAIFMWHLPRYLDQAQTFSTAGLSASAMMFAFTIFINIHHYFIDNVMWRSDNPEMKQYLFSK